MVPRGQLVKLSQLQQFPESEIYLNGQDLALQTKIIHETLCQAVRNGGPYKPGIVTNVGTKIPYAIMNSVLIGNPLVSTL